MKIAIGGFTAYLPETRVAKTNAVRAHSKPQARLGKTAKVKKPNNK